MVRTQAALSMDAIGSLKGLEQTFPAIVVAAFNASAPPPTAYRSDSAVAFSSVFRVRF